MLGLAVHSDFVLQGAAGEHHDLTGTSRYTSSYFGANLCIISVTALALLQVRKVPCSCNALWHKPCCSCKLVPYSCNALWHKPISISTTALALLQDRADPDRHATLQVTLLLSSLQLQ